MPLSRREFLARSAVALAAGAAAACNRKSGSEALTEEDLANEDPMPEPHAARPSALRNANDWDEVRDQFALSDDFIHISALYVASHPKPVRQAIERYRAELDSNPVLYLNQQNRRRVGEALLAAANYLGVNDTYDLALTDSTTMGIGLVYNGLKLNEGDEVISTRSDYYATHEALRLAALRKNISIKFVSLYEDIQTVSEQQLVDALISAIGPRTRVMALTWVHSGTGLKLPLARISAAVRDINAARSEQDQILICVDGVHGFGVENATLPELGCDFFMAGCHKWLFGPRGTGLIWGSPRGWENVLSTVPSFYDSGTRKAWLNDTEVTGRTDGQRMSPGGFKPFEHQWALTEAFALHQEIGKARIAARTHELAQQLKEGLRGMQHVMLRTPLDEALTAGIICMEVAGLNPYQVVGRLRKQGIIATVTPYAERYVRFAPSIRNSPSEIEAVVRAVHSLA